MDAERKGRLWTLFRVFFKISAVSVGGGLTMLPLMSREFSEERKWITEAARESSLYQRELWKEAEKLARERAEKQGVRFLNVDTAEFADRMKPMYDSMPAKTAELICKIREVK